MYDAIALSIGAALSCIGMLSVLFASRARQRGMRAAPYHGLAAICFAVSSVLAGLVNRHFNAYLSAAVAATSAFLWWHNGGGDGTKRRLKSWASRFQGVRRTAPSHV